MAFKEEEITKTKVTKFGVMTIVKRIYKNYINGVVSIKVGTRTYYVNIYKTHTDFLGEGPLKNAEVNWGAFGSASPESAEVYALLLKTASKVARDLDKKYHN
jgi:hypothetical protein